MTFLPPAADGGTRRYGGARPVVIGGTARGRAGNRRVVVLVTK